MASLAQVVLVGQTFCIPNGCKEDFTATEFGYLATLQGLGAALSFAAANPNDTLRADHF